MFRRAVARRQNVKLMVGLAGPSGSGKTYSALQLAFGITGDWSKIALADTENKSALYYAGAKTGDWQHIEFPSTMRDGYHPKNWQSLIEFAEKDLATEVLILDSISHEWDGIGGCLEIIDRIGKGFTGWKTVTPLHNGFVDAIRHSRLHVIATMRTKCEYVMQQNDKGKTEPKKVGTKSNQREGIDYEFGVIFDIDMNHNATTSKDRTGLFATRTPFRINAEVGKELVDWANQGLRIVPDVDLYDPKNPKHKAWLFNELSKRNVPVETMKAVSAALAGRPEIELDTALAEVEETHAANT